MQERGYDGPAPSIMTNIPGWERFDHCRLWPDHLAVFELRDRLSHECRMHAGPRGRLPA